MCVSSFLSFSSVGFDRLCVLVLVFWPVRLSIFT